MRERHKVKVKNVALIHHGVFTNITARQTEESRLTVQNKMSTTTAVLRNVLVRSLLLSYVIVCCRCIGVHVVSVGCLGDISLCCSSGRWFVCCTLIMLIALIVTSAAVLFHYSICSVFWLIVRKVCALSASVCLCKRDLLSECNFPLAILTYFINNIYIYK